MPVASKSHVGVVGGGLVGATAALALAQQGFKVTLLDRREPVVTRGKLGLDIRNVALSPASQALLNTVGAWGEVEKAPYQRMCVWEQWGSGQVEFTAAEADREELGWLVEMSPLVCLAWQRLHASALIDVVLDQISDVEVRNDSVVLTLDANSELSVDFLVAADGAQSVVRKALSLPVQAHPTHQVALATVVKTEHSHQHTAWQRFLVDGPLAFLPGPDEHLCSIVWSQSESQVQRRLALDDQAFCAEIGQAIEHRLGEVLAVDQRLSFPLTQQRVKNCAPHARVLLLGDAMRVVHPLAGQGVNLGLEDVRAMLAVSAAQDDLAYPGLWQRYARERQTRSALMIRTMAALQKIYANTNPLVTLLRNFGVQSFNASDALKRQIMREAMGLGQLSGTSKIAS